MRKGKGNKMARKKTIEKIETKTEAKNEAPMVMVGRRGNIFELKEVAGNTIRISDGMTEYCIAKANAVPANDAAKEAFKG